MFYSNFYLLGKVSLAHVTSIVYEILEWGISFITNMVF